MATYSEFATQRLHKAVQQKLKFFLDLGIIGHTLVEHATDQAILIIVTAKGVFKFEFKYDSSTLNWIQLKWNVVKTEQTPLITLAQLFDNYKNW